MNKTFLLKRSMLGLGSSAIVLGLMVGTPVGAQELPGDTAETSRLYIGHRIDDNGVYFGQKHRGKMFSPEMVEEITEFLGISTEKFEAAKNNKELREQYGDQLQTFHEVKIAEHAAELGISLEELEARQLERKANQPQMRDKKMNLEQFAEKLGISVEELRASKDDPELREALKEKMDVFHQERLVERAAELGITIDELETQFQERKANLNNGIFNQNQPKSSMGFGLR